MVSHSDQCYHPHFSMSSLTTQATVVNNSTHTVVPAFSDHSKEWPPAVYDHLLYMTTCCIRPPAVYDHLLYTTTFSCTDHYPCFVLPLTGDPLFYATNDLSIVVEGWLSDLYERPQTTHIQNGRSKTHMWKVCLFSNLTSYKHVRHICHMVFMWSIPNVSERYKMLLFCIFVK